MATNSVIGLLRFCGTVYDRLHELTDVLTCVQCILLVTDIIQTFFTLKTRWTQVRTLVKSCSQSQTVPHYLRTQNTEFVAVAQTLQGAFSFFSLLRINCRVCTQAISLKCASSIDVLPHIHALCITVSIDSFYLVSQSESFVLQVCWRLLIPECTCIIHWYFAISARIANLLMIVSIK